MKKLSTQRLTFLPLSLKNRKSFKEPSADLFHCSSARTIVRNIQIKSADPFENLKKTGKSNPTLRPILNKHRKVPSLVMPIHTESNISVDQPCSKSLNLTKSENSLPKIFKVQMQNKKCASKESLPPLISQIDSRSIVTPYFRPDNSHTSSRIHLKIQPENLLRCKKTPRKRFFDHIKRKDLGEISFGDISNNVNSVFYKNKQAF